MKVRASSPEPDDDFQTCAAGVRRLGPPDRDAFTWPEVMVMRRAVLYTGLGRSTIYRRIREGKLVPVARCGGQQTFSRASLDQLLVGRDVGAEDEDDDRPRAPVIALRGSRTSAATSAAALARLRSVRDGSAR